MSPGPDPSVMLSLLGGGFVAAFLHAALPTHWLPFTLVGRAQGWRPSRILAVVATAGLAHIIATAAVGALIVAAGLALDRGRPRRGPGAQGIPGARRPPVTIRFERAGVAVRTPAASGRGSATSCCSALPTIPWRPMPASVSRCGATHPRPASPSSPGRGGVSAPRERG